MGANSDQNFVMQSLHHQVNFVKIWMLGVQQKAKYNVSKYSEPFTRCSVKGSENFKEL